MKSKEMKVNIWMGPGQIYGALAAINCIWTKICSGPLDLIFQCDLLSIDISSYNNMIMVKMKIIMYYQNIHIPNK